MRPAEILRKPNTIIHDTKLNLDKCARHFKTQLRRSPPIDHRLNPEEQKKCLRHVETRQPTATKVAKVLKSLKNRAPANDEIKPKLFKYGSDQLVGFLEKLLRSVWVEKRDQSSEGELSESPF